MIDTTEDGMLKCTNRNCRKDVSKGGGKLLQWTSLDQPSERVDIPHGHRYICAQCWDDLTGSKFKLSQVEPRSEVKQFAYAMEQQLRDNEHRGGWQDERAEFLLTGAATHLARLKRIIKSARRTTDEHDDCILKDAPGVANFMMMIHDLWTQSSLERCDGSKV